MKKFLLASPFLIFLVLTALSFGPTFFDFALHTGRYDWIPAVGTSMYPTIKSGAILIYEKHPNQIKVGDIIIYWFKVTSPYKVYFPPQFWGKTILIGHRVIRIAPSGYVVLGDNNTMVDPWIVHRYQVVGKVVWIDNSDILKGIFMMWLHVFGYKV